MQLNIVHLDENGISLIHIKEATSRTTGRSKAPTGQVNDLDTSILWLNDLFRSAERDTNGDRIRICMKDKRGYGM